MTRCHSWIPGLLMMVLLAMASAPSWAGDRIGAAASTNPNADGITAGNSQPLVAGSEVYANETVRTGNLGQADLVFVDNTNLTVGPTSEARLDEFVYDPTGAKGRVVFQATRGAFRFVAGTQDHRAYALKTPSGSLGDGSDFNGQFEAMDHQAALSPPLHEHDVAHGGGGLMSYAPGGPGQYQGGPGQHQGGPGQYQGGPQYQNVGGGGTIELVVSNKKSDECVTRVRLVNPPPSGQGVTFTTNEGKKGRITEPNQTMCISATGVISYGSSTTSILSFSLQAQLTTVVTSGSAVTSGGTGVQTQPSCAPHCPGQ
jgi:FecR protein